MSIHVRSQNAYILQWSTMLLHDIRDTVYRTSPARRLAIQQVWLWPKKISGSTNCSLTHNSHHGARRVKYHAEDKKVECCTQDSVEWWPFLEAVEFRSFPKDNNLWLSSPICWNSWIVVSSTWLEASYVHIHLWRNLWNQFETTSHSFKLVFPLNT